jgi:N-acetylmuramoyl-L-alanine amidase
MKLLLTLSAISLISMLSSCVGPNQGATNIAGMPRSSSTRDVMGHRAGPQGFRTVVIDAGHGGKDSGAVSKITKQQEKDLTLDTAKRLQAALAGQFNVVMMRSNDTFVELDDRVARANQYGDAILISIHYNESGPANAGPETYYWRVDSHGLATRAQTAMAAVSPSHNSRGMVRRRIRLTRNPEIPSLLVEIGYLSNSGDANRCGDANYRQAMANALAGAIRAQAAQGDAGTGPLPAPINAPPSRPNDAKE